MRRQPRPSVAGQRLPAVGERGGRLRAGPAHEPRARQHRQKRVEPAARDELLRIVERADDVVEQLRRARIFQIERRSYIPTQARVVELQVHGQRRRTALDGQLADQLQPAHVHACCRIVDQPTVRLADGDVHGRRRRRIQADATAGEGEPPQLERDVGGDVGLAIVRFRQAQPGPYSPGEVRGLVAGGGVGCRQRCGELRDQVVVEAARDGQRGHDCRVERGRQRARERRGWKRRRERRRTGLAHFPARGQSSEQIDRLPERRTDRGQPARHERRDHAQGIVERRIGQFVVVGVAERRSENGQPGESRGLGSGEGLGHSAEVRVRHHDDARRRIDLADGGQHGVERCDGVVQRPVAVVGEIDNVPACRHHAAEIGLLGRRAGYAQADAAAIGRGDSGEQRLPAVGRGEARRQQHSGPVIRRTRRREPAEPVLDLADRAGGRRQSVVRGRHGLSHRPSLGVRYGARAIDDAIAVEQDVIQELQDRTRQGGVAVAEEIGDIGGAAGAPERCGQQISPAGDFVWRGRQRSLHPRRGRTGRPLPQRELQRLLAERLQGQSPGTVDRARAVDGQRWLQRIAARQRHAAGQEIVNALERRAQQRNAVGGESRCVAGQCAEPRSDGCQG